MKIGYCLTGSFCTFSDAINTIEELVEAGHIVTPIMSENAYTINTRFGDAVDIQNKLIEITGNSIIHTIEQAEPIGPKSLFDVLVIAPCTANTLAKLAAGIVDTSVTMAAKSHLRNMQTQALVIWLVGTKGLIISITVHLQASLRLMMSHPMQVLYMLIKVG